MVNRLRDRFSGQSIFFITSIGIIALLPLGFTDERTTMHLLILSLVWSVVASSWNLIMGYARILSFGQIAFFAIGGYGAAMLSLNWGVSPWLSMLAGGFLSCGIGLGIGLICLRLRGIYVGIVTFALHLVMPTIMTAGRAWGTGGSWGLTNIPLPMIGGLAFSKLDLIPWYYVAFGFFVGFLYLIYKIINSRTGLAFMALRDSETFAKTLGINEYRFSVIVFGISSLITGVMGGFYAHYMRLISPTIFNLDYFLLALIMVMLGGLGKFPGGIIGAYIITFLNHYLVAYEAGRLVIMGAIVVSVMIAFPNGIMGIFEYIKRYRTRKSYIERLRLNK